MTLVVKLRQRLEEAEYGDRATWVNPRGVFSSFMFLQGRLAMPNNRRGVWKHATLLFCTSRAVLFGPCRKEENGRQEHIRGSRNLNDTPFFASRGKYTVENMEDSIYQKYGIDPSRIPTDAEVELVAHCFDVSLQEAFAILGTRKLNTSSHLASGAYDGTVRGEENKNES